MATTLTNPTAELVVNETTPKPLLADIKNGKASLKQKPITYDKASETMSELVRFREMLDERTDQQSSQLDEVPEGYLPLIAKLVQESDKTLSALTKSVHHTLLPPRDEDEDVFRSASTSASLPISIGAVERAINAIAVRTNYGVDKGADGTKIPAALCVWRWEVKEAHREWLPKSAREKADVRLAERVQAKRDLQAFLDALSQSERAALLQGKQPLKEKAKLNATPSASTQPPSEPDTKDAKDPAASPQARRTIALDVGENDESETTSASAKKRGRPKKSADPEKEEKEKERAEKKAEREAKEKEKADKKAARAEREEKQKKAQDKSRNIMASFFGANAKPKAPPSAPILTEGSGTLLAQAVSSADTGSRVLASGSDVPDFQRTFKPFVVKKDAEMAAQNWFQHAKSKDRRKMRQSKGKARAASAVIDVDADEHRPEASREIIELSDSDDDVEMKDGTTPELELTNLSTRDHLRHVLSTLPRSSLDLRRPPRTVPPLKTPVTHSVRVLMAQLSEAEVSGDDALVRRLLALLGDRAAIPARILSFHEDERPGYYGTFTRTSSIIGPRAPLAKDEVALDYTCDSGDEWEGEEEVAGEDVHEEDVEEDEDEEEDSDADSWLVDDDEVEEEGTPLSDGMMRSPSPFAVPQLPAPKKRKTDAAGEEKREKKRKVVIPLVPFTKGPCWEREIGACTYEPFEQYRVQIFNNAPVSIDPFTWVSETMDISRADRHAVPSLPDPRIAASSSDSRAPSAPAEDAGGKSKPPKAKPKNPFPDAHMPLLLARITSLATSSVLGIVETVYAELKEHKVKKNAIEAKVKEVGEKCKQKKVWVVKADVKALYPELLS